jgi:hypothetical protein
MFKLSLQIIFTLFFINTVFAEQQLIQSVRIDCKENCAIHASRKWQEKALEVKLTRGKYKFVPLKGACSQWPNDRSAFDTGNQPWMWYAIISVNGDQYELGSQAKYKTPNAALKEQADEKVTIRLEADTSIRIGSTDVWKGKDYCSDNRGTEELGIYRIVSENE